MEFDKDAHDYTEDLAVWAKVIINKLNDAGVGWLQCNIHGSGDSPNGEDWEIFNRVFTADDNLTDAERQAAYMSEKNVPQALLAEISAFFWDWCDESGHSGWYNNEGGYMTLEISVKCEKPEVKAELWEYPEPEAFLSVTNSYSAE